MSHCRCSILHFYCSHMHVNAHKNCVTVHLLRWVKSLKDWKIWAEHCNLALSSGTILNWEGHGAQPVLLHKQWGCWWLTNLLGFCHLTKWLHWTIFPSWLPPNKTLKLHCCWWTSHLALNQGSKSNTYPLQILSCWYLCKLINQHLLQ